MSSILLATDDDALEQRIRAAFGAALNGDLRRFAVGGTDLVGALERLLALDTPEIVILGGDLTPKMALGLAQRLDQERPDIGVMLVAPRSPTVLEQAMRAGVRGVISPEASGGEVREAVEHALEATVRRRTRLAGLPTPAPTGHVIVVSSPKGGSGKTTVCANLAVALARGDAGSTVLVDLDLQFGDIGSALRLLPEASWLDVSRAGVLDATSLKVFLTRHASGLYVLCSPEEPADGDFVTVEQVVAVLSLLAAEFRHVVVDTAAGLDEFALAALEAATDAVFVCSMDVPSVRSLRKEITALDRLGTTSGRRHFLLNRADARVGLAVEDVEATVGMPVDVSVPSSRAVPLALNQGIPIVEAEPRSAVARQFSALASRFSPQEQERTGFRLRRKDRP